MVVEAAFLAGVLGLVIYAVTSLLLRSLGQHSPPVTGTQLPGTGRPGRSLPAAAPAVPPGSTQPGTWRVAHYDAQGRTHVVLRRIAPDHRLLDEHVVASVPSDDPEYDERFLAAMSAARQRQALFEAEERDG